MLPATQGKIKQRMSERSLVGGQSKAGVVHQSSGPRVQCRATPFVPKPLKSLNNHFFSQSVSVMAGMARHSFSLPLKPTFMKNKEQKDTSIAEQEAEGEPPAEELEQSPPLNLDKPQSLAEIAGDLPTIVVKNAEDDTTNDVPSEDLNEDLKHDGTRKPRGSNITRVGLVPSDVQDFLDRINTSGLARPKRGSRHKKAPRAGAPDPSAAATSQNPGQSAVRSLFVPSPSPSEGPSQGPGPGPSPGPSPVSSQAAGGGRGRFGSFDESPVKQAQAGPRRQPKVTLQTSKSPDPFADQHDQTESQLKAIISSTSSPENPLHHLQQRGMHSAGYQRAYKHFIISLFESIFFIKQMTLITEEQALARRVSIPRPLTVSCILDSGTSDSEQDPGDRLGRDLGPLCGGWQVRRCYCHDPSIRQSVGCG
jgi:hypothetical protein